MVMQVHVGGGNWKESPLNPEVIEMLDEMGWKEPFAIQMQAIPIACEFRDLIGIAQTGSGKTAAFMFPVIAGILRSNPPPPVRGRKAFPLALVMSPTRELASQIMEESRKFSYQTGLKVVVCYGGAPIHHQMRELERGCDILVGRRRKFYRRICVLQY